MKGFVIKNHGTKYPMSIGFNLESNVICKPEPRPIVHLAPFVFIPFGELTTTLLQINVVTTLPLKPFLPLSISFKSIDLLVKYGAKVFVIANALSLALSTRSV